MQNLRISKVIAGLAVLVVLAGIVLHFLSRGPQTAPVQAVPPEPAGSQTPTGIPHLLRNAEATTSGPETQELAIVVSELLEAAGKPAFKDYAMEFKLDGEELNMAAGRSSLQARLSSSGWAQDLSPQLASLKALAQDVAALQKQYVGAGDSGSAENLAQAGLMLASGLRSGDADKFVIKQLVGNAIEAIMLSQLDPNGSYDFLGGKSPNDRLAELKEQRVSLRGLTQAIQDALPNMTEAELLSYTERQRLYGELEAMRWLQQRRSTTSGPERSQ